MPYKKILGFIVVLLLFLAIYYYTDNCYNVFNDYVYLDNNGTTEMPKKVIRAYTKNANIGNCSAIYADKAREVLHNTKQTLNQWLMHDCRIIFNSGASEGNNQVLKTYGIKGAHIIISAIEHKTSIECAKDLMNNGVEVTFIKPNIYGIITVDKVINAIKSNTSLISIMAANNETGNINPIYRIAEIARKNNIIFHSDVVQYIGKFPINMTYGPHIITGSFHKIHGPPGCGFIAYTDVILSPMIHGSQMDGLRGGTENMPAIAAANEAMKYTFKNRKTKNNKMKYLRGYMMHMLVKEFPIIGINNLVDKNDNYIPPYNVIDNRNAHNSDIAMIPLSSNVLPNTLALSFVKIDKPYTKYNKVCNLKLRENLLKQKVIIGIGSACNTSSKKPNHVLSAMGLPHVVRAGMIRISLSDENTICEVVDGVKKLIKELRRF